MKSALAFVHIDDLDILPAVGGAYALAISLSRHLKDLGPAQASGDLVADTYLYVGSAYGPGGIRARVRRHARADKPIHWHVDRLTRAGRIVGVLALPGAEECDIVERARAAHPASAPIPGFGSSDCRRCDAHLLRWSAGHDLAKLEHGVARPVLWRAKTIRRP